MEAYIMLYLILKLVLNWLQTGRWCHGVQCAVRALYDVPVPL
jgi:hypothetical protein